MSEAESTYVELAAVIDNLPLIVRESRRARGISLRTAGDQIGIDFNTLGRLERGATVRSGNISPILRWLDQTDDGHPR